VNIKLSQEVKEEEEAPLLEAPAPVGVEVAETELPAT
jgi:hypothetical protein